MVAGTAPSAIGRPFISPYASRYADSEIDAYKNWAQRRARSQFNSPAVVARTAAAKSGKPRGFNPNGLLSMFQQAHQNTADANSRRFDEIAGSLPRRRGGGGPARIAPTAPAPIPERENQLYSGSVVPLPSIRPEPTQSTTGRPLGFGGGGRRRSRDMGKLSEDSLEQPGLGGYTGQFARAMETLRRIGNQERSDINREYDARAGSAQSSMVDRGLSASTAAEVAQNQIGRERIGAIGRLDDRLAQMRLGADREISSDLLRFMERADDEYPDIQSLLALLSRYGAA